MSNSCDLMGVACQAPLSTGFSSQEYSSGLPFPPPGDLPDPGIRPRFPALQTDSLLTEMREAPLSILKYFLGKKNSFLIH